MEIKLSEVKNSNLLRTAAKDAEKVQPKTEQERPNYNQSSLDKMAALNRSLVKQSDI